MPVSQSWMLSAAGALLIATSSVATEPTSIEPDLATVVAGEGWTIVNRSITTVDNDGSRRSACREPAGSASRGSRTRSSTTV